MVVMVMTLLLCNGNTGEGSFLLGGSHIQAVGVHECPVLIG